MKKKCFRKGERKSGGKNKRKNIGISIAPPQVHYYSEALPTQHGYCVGSATDNYEYPRSLRGG